MAYRWSTLDNDFRWVDEHPEQAEICDECVTVTEFDDLRWDGDHVYCSYCFNLIYGEEK